jgi:hypothetical protein
MLKLLICLFALIPYKFKDGVLIGEKFESNIYMFNDGKFHYNKILFIQVDSLKYISSFKQHYKKELNGRNKHFYTNTMIYIMVENGSDSILNMKMKEMMLLVGNSFSVEGHRKFIYFSRNTNFVEYIKNNRHIDLIYMKIFTQDFSNEMDYHIGEIDSIFIMERKLFLESYKKKKIK